MSRYYSYLNSAERILQRYKGEEPFAIFTRQFFSSEKKYGSRDRKQISQLCYAYFRLGKSFNRRTLRERILIGYFLCSRQSDTLLEALAPEWAAAATKSLEEKLQVLSAEEELVSIFPWREELGEGIDHSLFARSFLIQPDLFVRIRPGQEAARKKAIEAGGRLCNDHCVAFPNTFSVEDILELDKEAVIQDKNSQAISAYFASGKDDKNWQVWDCCAASGGKSILAVDYLPVKKLTVSDIRSSILVNLRKRFERAGIREYNSLVLDLSRENYPDRQTRFDWIICDAPCSGSGTWSRTPEQLFFFNSNEMERYATLQKKIVDHALPALRKGGFFLYITCSVFRKENEEVVEHIIRHHSLTLVQSGYAKGYEEKADTLFAALFTA